MSAPAPNDLDGILRPSLEARAFRDVETSARECCRCCGGWSRAATRATTRSTSSGAPRPGSPIRPTRCSRASSSASSPGPTSTRSSSSTAGETAARSCSAHLDQRAFHRLELYQDVYRLIETEDQIAFRLPGEPLIAFSLNRSRRAVTARDVEILERLRPHLSRAYLEARERRHVATVIAALESGVEESARAVVVLGRDGQDGSTDAPFTLAGERGLLHARLLDGSGIDPWRVVLLHECRAQPPSVESLRGLGLSTREAQVLRLLACGKRDGDIARELDISVGTVRKHLQHVYRKLGVDSRAQAVSRALG